MANLKLEMRFEKYVPVVGGNDKLQVPFYFDLACGLTRAQMNALDKAVSAIFEREVKEAWESLGELPKDSSPEQRAEHEEARAALMLEAEIKGIARVLEPYVKIGAEPLTIDGQPIRTLEQYFRAVALVADQAAMEEPLRALRLANSLGGAQVVFSKRPSGGSTGTRSQPNGSAGNQTAAP